MLWSAGAGTLFVMESADHFKLDLLSLAVAAQHAQMNLERRAEELEDLAVHLAAVAAGAGAEVNELDEGEVELLALARRGSELRQMARDRRANASAGSAGLLHVVSDPPDAP